MDPEAALFYEVGIRNEEKGMALARVTQPEAHHRQACLWARYRPQILGYTVLRNKERLFIQT